MQGIDSTQHIASHTKVYTLARARLPRLRFLVLRQYEPSCIRWEVAILQNALRVFDTNRTSMTAVHTLQNLSLSHTKPQNLHGNIKQYRRGNPFRTKICTTRFKRQMKKCVSFDIRRRRTESF